MELLIFDNFFHLIEANQAMKLLYYTNDRFLQSHLEEKKMQTPVLW